MGMDALYFVQKYNLTQKMEITEIGRAPPVRWRASYFRLTANTPNVPGIILGRSPAAAGSVSAAGRNTVWVFGSTVQVRALRLVGTLSITEKAVAEDSLMTVSFPSPQEAKTRARPLSKATPSQPSPMGSLVTTSPVAAFMTTSCLSQPANNRMVFVSMARPVGPSAPSGQLAITVFVRIST